MIIIEKNKLKEFCLVQILLKNIIFFIFQIRTRISKISQS